jgi:hypothetical protein
VYAWSLALIFTVYAIDSLVNAMQNPVYLLVAGGLCGLAQSVAPAPMRRGAQRAWLPPMNAPMTEEAPR